MRNTTAAIVVGAGALAMGLAYLNIAGEFSGMLFLVGFLLACGGYFGWSFSAPGRGIPVHWSTAIYRQHARRAAARPDKNKNPPR
jgi:hypothetical protein